MPIKMEVQGTDKGSNQSTLKYSILITTKLNFEIQKCGHIKIKFEVEEYGNMPLGFVWAIPVV